VRVFVPGHPDSLGGAETREKLGHKTNREESGPT